MSVWCAPVLEVGAGKGYPAAMSMLFRKISFAPYGIGAISLRHVHMIYRCQVTILLSMAAERPSVTPAVSHFCPHTPIASFIGWQV